VLWGHNPNYRFSLRHTIYRSYIHERISAAPFLRLILSLSCFDHRSANFCINYSILCLGLLTRSKDFDRIVFEAEMPIFLESRLLTRIGLIHMLGATDLECNFSCSQRNSGGGNAGKKNPENKNCIGIHYAGRCVAAFIIGIVIHGILDITPHQYPLRARIDILISIVFFVVSIGRLLSRENRRHGKKMFFIFFSCRESQSALTHLCTPGMSVNLWGVSPLCVNPVNG